MYGRPKCLIKHCDVEPRAGTQACSHLSCYQLTLEPNTRFAAFPPCCCNGDLADMQEAIEARLAEAGLQITNISFCQNWKQCRSTLNYWHFRLSGIRAGAHSKLTLHDRGLAPNALEVFRRLTLKIRRQKTGFRKNPDRSSELAFEF